MDLKIDIAKLKKNFICPKSAIDLFNKYSDESTKLILDHGITMIIENIVRFLFILEGKPRKYCSAIIDEIKK